MQRGLIHHNVRLSLVLILSVCLYTQTLTNEEIAGMVQSFKDDVRGPFQSIRWFCPDSTNLPANQPCPEPGGIQHALHKTSVQQLAEQQGIYLAQILAGTRYEDFWDPSNQHLRAKQYILEKYLFYADDGWILRKALYYRGAYQVEDEEEWGIQFFRWLLQQDAPVREQFFLIRQMIMAVPHRKYDDRLIRIRSLSKDIADADNRFMNIRIKIHGQPEKKDLNDVYDFRKHYQSSLSSELGEKLTQLETDMEAYYQTSTLEILKPYMARFLKNQPIKNRLERLFDPLIKPIEARDICMALTDLLWITRQQIPETKSGTERLNLFDLSVDAEQILFVKVTEWQPYTIKELMEKANTLSNAAAACGFLEIWEWEQINPTLMPAQNLSVVDLATFDHMTASYRAIVEWSAGTVHAVMEPAIQIYGFEPLASGYFDDCIRRSPILSLGETASQLSDGAASKTGIRNQIIKIPDSHGIRGLNPGYAMGTLIVVPDSPENIQFSPKNIYVLSRSPANLTPVAGILTVSEGNLVSHVQLLARNLGIPNAVLNQTHLQVLLPLSGTEVFYAVSPRGAVIVKPVSKMTAEETMLVEIKSRNEERIRISVEKMRLNQITLMTLDKLRASDSGQLCGPKAANLGQLKFMFPEHVVNGIVIPFGTFDSHLDQLVPGRNITYWQMLQIVFRETERDRLNGIPENEIEIRVLERLAKYREWMRLMPFKAEFIADLEQSFRTVLGSELGKTPVFIRSDTNMEDLKDFTGAGLNLTVFNVVEKDKILRGIRDVWMSPFSERSYRWRQKYLLNPENVYPSILIMPSVNVDKSGVLITTGVTSGSSSDITVAFNRGVAGSVEGQISEQYLLKTDGQNILISPAREIQYTVIPKTGGTEKKYTALNQPILSSENLKQLRQIADLIQKRMENISGNQFGPYDVELGFLNDRLYLFQVRPFVENKAARSSGYLKGLDPPLPQSKNISLNAPWQSLMK